MVLMREIFAGTVLIAIAIAPVNEGSQIQFWNYRSMAIRGCGIVIPLTMTFLILM